MTIPHPPSFSFPAKSCAANCRNILRSWVCSRLFLGGAAAILLLTGGNAAAAAPSAWNAPSIATAADRFGVFVTEASQRFGIPTAWIRAVMQAESFGDVRALSPKGAMGLMQIMPETWADLRQRYGLGANPYDPRDNILAGAAYLRELLDRYGAPGFLAAYNAGPARYEEHLATGEPLPNETQDYLAEVTPLINGDTVGGPMAVAAVVHPWAESALFATLPESSSVASSMAFNSHDASPSADTSTADRTALAPQFDGLFVAINRWNPSR